MTTAAQSERSLREQKAYDEGDVFETSKRWQLRFLHVLRCPNALRQEADLDALLRRHLKGADVLEIGCGGGIVSEGLLAFEPRHVLGIDISHRFIEAAEARAVPGRLAFRVDDVSADIEGQFDVIFGRSILHHLDYRKVLTKLIERNLKPGGIMLFTEPLGENLLSRLYHFLVPSSQTDDEQPFMRQDLRWLKNTLGTEVMAYSYLSYPAGILSSFLFRKPDNPFTRLADRADIALARRAHFLTHRFRSAIFLMRHRHRAASADG